MESTKEIEKLFYQDVGAKKRIGNNIFRRKSTRRGGTNMSTMRVPTKKEQREMSGNVMTFNMNEILSIKEFENKSLADQKLLMEHWRKQYKAKDIIDAMGVNRNAYYNLVDNLGIPKAERRPKEKRDKPVYNVPNIVTNRELKETKEMVEIIPEKKDTVEAEEFNFTLKGKYNSEDVARRLEFLMHELELAEGKLNIEIRISK